MARQVFSKGVGNQGDVGRVPTAPGSREPDPQAVPALSGFDPSREELVRFYSAMDPCELEKRISEYDATGIVIEGFAIHPFKDGEDLGLPKWAKHILIGGFRERGWSAYDQLQNGKIVAAGEWGDSLLRLRHGRVTSKSHRYYAGVIQDALAIAMEARQGGDGEAGSVACDDSAGPKDIAQPSAQS